MQTAKPIVNRNDKPAQLPSISTQVAVIGGGIAGIWAALKLANRGIPTVLVTYKSTDRGGVQGSTGRSVGAINTTPLSDKDFAKLLDEMSRGQANPSIGKALVKRLRGEIQALCQFTDLEEINIGLRLAKSDAKRLLTRLCDEFQERGGTIVDGWVTRIVADSRECRGVQYQSTEGIGKLRSRFIVVASGGYAGLFDGSVQTASYGTVLGQYMQCGGGAVNLEFLFKHGYGKPDMGQLTPTEELRGAEILDQDGKNVVWLERELYNGNGTHNHQRAMRFWRDHRTQSFYVSHRHRSFHDRIQSLNRLLAEDESTPFRQLRQHFASLLELLSSNDHACLRRRIVQQIRDQRHIAYDLYAELRKACPHTDSGQRPVRIRQIAYFTMGGAAHQDFKTNLCNVFVTGEAMHDFGANRVGGLPWGLYLVAGEAIAEQIAQCDHARRCDRSFGDFEIVQDKSEFDASILQRIQSLLYRHQERSFSTEKAASAICWLRATRRRLLRGNAKLSDAISWLIVAEAIFKASLSRQESRGCFLRDDFVKENDKLRDYYTYCYYDDVTDHVTCRLVAKRDFDGFFSGQCTREHSHV